jgi:sporulation-control protein
MLDKLLAKIGIGNASIDLTLTERTVSPGSEVGAEIHVTGGKVEQDVQYIELELETRYLVETDEGTAYEDYEIDRSKVTSTLKIIPDTNETYETTLQVPLETPLTYGDADVWAEADLEISGALDAETKASLNVEPTERMQALFDAAEELGLSMHTADCEADRSSRYVSRRPFVQEIEYKPRGGPFASDLDELEFIFDPRQDELMVFVEVDKNAGLLGELADADEQKTQFSLRDGDVDTAVDKLETAITDNI